MDDAELYSAALYCAICPLEKLCGGLHCKASPLGCEEFCCGQKSGCTTVCPANPLYLQQLAEVGGFDLHSAPVGRGHAINIRQTIVPLIYHGSKRAQRFEGECVALRLADLVDFEKRSCRFASRAALCEAFKLQNHCDIIVTGVDHDPEIERIWRLHEARERVFGEIAALGIACATTPNFSMILAVPRPDNLHAMQRIAIVYAEMSNAGLPTAIHVNGRTEQDFIRWGEFLRRRPDISAISYEFITGSGLVGRIAKHIGWLNSLQRAAGRPLTCMTRGNPAALDLLDEQFDVVYVETTSFVKAVKRQVSVRIGNMRLAWHTERKGGADISRCLHTNFDEVRTALVTRYPRLRLKA